jgi:hypothetical protein
MVSWMMILACLMPTNDALPPWDPKTKNPLNQWMGSISIADFSAIDIVERTTRRHEAAQNMGLMTWYSHAIYPCNNAGPH